MYAIAAKNLYLGLLTLLLGLVNPGINIVRETDMCLDAQSFTYITVYIYDLYFRARAIPSRGLYLLRQLEHRIYPVSW